jgi:hypothetical protein
LLTPKVRVDAFISAELAERMKEFMKVYHIRSVTKATHDLLEVGLKAIENIGLVNTPEKVAALIKEFEDGTMVDYIEKLDRTQFEVLWSIMSTERNLRYGLKAGQRQQ